MHDVCMGGGGAIHNVYHLYCTALLQEMTIVSFLEYIHTTILKSYFEIVLVLLSSKCVYNIPGMILLSFPVIEQYSINGIHCV